MKTEEPLKDADEREEMVMKGRFLAGSLCVSYS